VLAQPAVVADRDAVTAEHPGPSSYEVVGAVSVPSQSRVAWVPSQNGLFDEPPHRHSE